MEDEEEEDEGMEDEEEDEGMEGEEVDEGMEEKEEKGMGTRRRTRG